MDYNIFLFMLDRISLLFLFAYIAFFSHLRYSLVKTTFIFSISYIIIGIMDYLPLIHSPMPIIPLEILAVQLTALIVSEYRDIRAIYIGTSASVFVLFGDILCSILFNAFGSILLSFAVQIFVHIMLLLILIHFTRKTLLNELKYNRSFWFFMTSIPALFYMSILALGEPSSALVAVRQENIPAVIVILSLLTITNIVCMQSLAQHTKLFEQEKEALFLETYADGLLRNINEYHSSSEQLSCIRHDAKHYGQMILSFIDNNEPDRIREIVTQLNAMVDSVNQKSLCENIPLNAILTAYSQRAENNGISFKCKADVPETLDKINIYEFSAVVANLLDNALRAASANTGDSEKYVAIQILPVKGMLMLEVRNPYQWTLNIDKVTGLPQTNQGSLHGYGMKSVQAFVKKNNASYDLSYKDHIFCIKMILKI